jgi:signal transduction histidine kinase
LAIVWSLLEKHNGKITVESEVGKGTTFRILLPVNEMKE